MDKMMLDTWLRVGAIGIPLVGALVIGRWGARFPRTQRRLVASILGTSGLVALTLFLLNRYDACVLSFGGGNCLFDGLATLSLFLLSGILVRSCLNMRGENRRPDYVPRLLLSSAWAGIGLTRNLFMLLVFLNLFLFAIDRGLKRRGLKWRFMVLRDDYQDDVK